MISVLFAVASAVLWCLPVSAQMASLNDSTRACPGCDLRRARLFAADLAGADLRGADLYWANLKRADLRGARLDSAVLRGRFGGIV